MCKLFKLYFLLMPHFLLLCQNIQTSEDRDTPHFVLSYLQQMLTVFTSATGVSALPITLTKSATQSRVFHTSPQKMPK